MEEKKDNKPQASFMYSMKAVIWSFFGLRRKKDFEQDGARLNPFHVIIAALIGVALFIAVLITIVKFAVSK